MYNSLSLANACPGCFTLLAVTCDPYAQHSVTGVKYCDVQLVLGVPYVERLLACVNCHGDKVHDMVQH